MATKISPGQLVIYLAVVLSLVSVIFAGLFNRLDAIVLGLGIALVSYASGVNAPTMLLMASLATFLASYLPFGHTSTAVIQGFSEGFSSGNEDFEDKNGGDAFDEDGDNFDEDGDNFEGDDGEHFEGEEEFTNSNEAEEFTEDADAFDEDGDNFDEDGDNFEESEGFANPDEKANAKPKKKRRPAPDHGSRAEIFELGKKYKMPKETDDEEFHLDAGTTFMNAYKQLKPDQITAMTKDTQELINTQKQLMSTLNTLKPLITDGKQIMDTFQNYFGSSGGAAGLGDLTKMAEKFAPGAGIA